MEKRNFAEETLSGELSTVNVFFINILEPFSIWRFCARFFRTLRFYNKVWKQQLFIQLNSKWLSIWLLPQIGISSLNFIAISLYQFTWFLAIVVRYATLQVLATNRRQLPFVYASSGFNSPLPWSLHLSSVHVYYNFYIKEYASYLTKWYKIT